MKILKKKFLHIEGIEHYGTITDIVAMFKVTDKDTFLFAWISHTVLYSNRVLSVVDRLKKMWN